MASFVAAHPPVYPNANAFTASLTGYGTAWTAGTPGTPTFTIVGGVGASIVSQSVADATHATVIINPGTAIGTLTLTDPSTAATATIVVKHRPPAWSPRPRR